MKVNNKEQNNISIELIQHIEMVYFINFIRRESLRRFGTSLLNIDEKKFINTDLDKIKNIKPYLNGDKLKVMDVDLIDALSLFGKYVDEYFNELNNLIFGQLYAVYKDSTSREESKIINYLIKELEGDGKLIVPPDLKIKDFNSVYDFLVSLRDSWKSLKNKKIKTHVS